MTFTSPVCCATEADLSNSTTASPTKNTHSDHPSSPTVVSVSVSPSHTFSKTPEPFIRLITGLGIEGDAHAGVTTQHLYAKARKPEQENLRQVHLISSEFLEGLKKEDDGKVVPGELGENITTVGIEILDLTKDTVLEFRDATCGDEQSKEGGNGEREGEQLEWARIRIQGLRNPCSLIEKHGKGLQAQCMEKDGWRVTKRKCGIMATVERGGVVRPGMMIVVVEVGSERLKVV